MRTFTHAAISTTILALAACSSGPAPQIASTPKPTTAAKTEVVERVSEAKESAPAETHAKTAGDVLVDKKDARPRIGAYSAFVWIQKHPSWEGLAIGSMRMGTSLPLKSKEPVTGKGCGRGWYAVEPRGYVCLSPQTTLDLEEPYFKSLAAAAPGPEDVWHYRYAFSNGAPMYSRVPTNEEADHFELPRLGARGSFVQLGEWGRGHEELLESAPIKATDPVPEIFADGKRHVPGGTRNVDLLVWRVIPNGSILAYKKAFEMNGRTWLLTPDLMLVPADRVRSMRRSTFHGVMLDEGADGPRSGSGATKIVLPLAWNRTKGMKPKYKKQDGAMIAVADAFPPKTWIMVTEEKVTSNGRTFLPVRNEPDTFVEESDVTVTTSRHGKLPNGVAPGERWIEAKILTGTLTAYEGDRPVRASLFSPGKGGVPAPGLDHTKYATTAMGFFPIEWKDHIATMTNEQGEPKRYWFTDVPHIQYLRAPLAMHVAFWHEDFGNPKSAECVNVSPEDGRWLFDWTLPHLPEGWGGVRPGDGNGKSTPVIVTAR